MTAVSSSDRKTPLSAAPRGAPRMMVTLATAKQNAEASAQISPMAGDADQ
jgi:hypothetical protein